MLPKVNNLVHDSPLKSNGGRLESHLVTAMQLLSRSIRRQNPQAFTEASVKLVGAGVGLTPSGDDILIGVIAFLVSRFGLTKEDVWFTPAFSQLKSSIKGKTTLVSETLLTHALNGRFPERLMDLLQALDARDRKELLHASEALTRFGKTTGGEMALGVILAQTSIAAYQP